MKRSEAITNISHIIDKMGMVSSIYLAKKILDYLEYDGGMSPPKNSNRYENYPTVTPTGNFDYEFSKEWEPEDGQE